MNRQRRQTLRSLAAAAAAAAVRPLAAQDTRPLVLVVPFAAGGATDNVARFLATRLQTRLGRNVVVENRPGANGLVGSQFVLQQPADGQTLLLGSYSTHVIAPLATRRPGDAARSTLTDFQALALVGHAPLALAVATASPLRSLADFAARAKAVPTTFGTFGAGSSAHLLGQVLAARLGVRLVHVPYKGSGPATTDLVGGHVDAVILTAAAVSPLAASGQLRVLAVSSKARLQALPAVPTLAEQGQPDLADTGWFALFAPTRVPTDARARLATALSAITAEPAVRQRLVELGLEPADDAEDAQALWQRSVEAARAMLARVHFDPE